ncbi:MAG: tRNA lysidine(34) synthetase TilS [Synergistaceae bacterium]|jgi:tRNA(Ile)-lysidine synthase|nr:tRNA lysidine(34) synthetase TilS [Synergistaceae bacterium]
MASLVEKILLREIASAGKRQGWGTSCGILVALSGGGDSMALLSLLRRVYGGRVAAAHLEHGLRGEASRADAEFVENFCKDAGVPCFVKRANVAVEREKGESVETAGRRMRYEFFGEICERENLPFVATAHNAGDAAETVAYRVFRGSGIAGLAGISERRANIVRPLINCRREDLRRFLRENGIPWREDETNWENDYVRNRIRNSLFPWVRENINKSADRALLGLAGECSRVSSVIGAESDILLRLVERRHPLALAAWDACAARRLSDIQLPEVIRRQAEELRLPVADRRRIAELCGLIRKGGRSRFQWAYDVEVCCGGAVIGWLRRSCFESPGAIQFSIGAGETASIKWGSWTMFFESKPARRARCKGVWKAVLPSADGSGAITISDADNFIKKNKFYFDVKIPWWSTHNTPIICYESENICHNWLPGIRYTVRHTSDYVIIANIFASERTGLKGENL